MLDAVAFCRMVTVQAFGGDAFNGEHCALLERMPSNGAIRNRTFAAKMPVAGIYMSVELSVDASNGEHLAFEELYNCMDLFHREVLGDGSM